MRNPQPSDDELAAIYTDHYFIDRVPAATSTRRQAVLKRETAALYLDEIEVRLGGDATSRRGLELLEIGYDDAKAAGFSL